MGWDGFVAGKCTSACGGGKSKAWSRDADESLVIAHPAVYNVAYWGGGEQGGEQEGNGKGIAWV